MALQQDFRTAFNGFNREDVVHYIEQMNAKHNAEVSRLNSDIQYLQDKLAQYELNADEAAAPDTALEEKIQEQAQQIAELEAKLASASKSVEAAPVCVAADASDAEKIVALEEQNAQQAAQIASLQRQLSESQDATRAAKASLAKVKEDNEGLQALLDTALSRQSHVQSQQEAELSAYRRAERVERQAKERATQINDQVNGALADATAKVDEAAAHVSAVAEEVMQQIKKLQLAVSDSKLILKDAATNLYTIHPNED